jgi:AcrR family transcriptional regulator
LSREFVAANQRERILEALADAVSAAGYAATSVEDIVSAAGVSRRTFYDNFSSKEDAFLAAYDAIAGQLVQRVYAAYDSTDEFTLRVWRCLQKFLEFLSEHPHYADACIVEVLVAGPAALAKRNAVMTGFADLLCQAAESLEQRPRPPRLAAETIVGGIYEIVYSRVLQGQAAQLPELLPDLAYSMMLPYVGHVAAELALGGLDRERAGRSRRRQRGVPGDGDGIAAMPALRSAPE